jgi:signal transduction histidine kinase
VPVSADEHQTGWICICSDEYDAFDDHHAEVVKEIAAALGLAVRQIRLQSRIRSANARLTALARQLVSAQEDERRHLALELHDDVGSLLLGARLQLDAAMAVEADERCRSVLRDQKQIVDLTLASVRALALDLRPMVLDDLGLKPAVRWLLDRHTRNTDIQVSLLSDGLDNRPPASVELAGFRVTQEAVSNVIRHAGADSLRVELKRIDNMLHVVVQDNGEGFDVDEAFLRAAQETSMGILSMRERVMLLNGAFTIRSQPGEGTRVEASFPV